MSEKKLKTKLYCFGNKVQGLKSRTRITYCKKQDIFNSLQ